MKQVRSNRLLVRRRYESLMSHVDIEFVKSPKEGWSMSGTLGNQNGTRDTPYRRKKS